MSKEKIHAEGVKFEKADFAANVVETTKVIDGVATPFKNLELVAKPERVQEEFKTNLPASVTIEQVKDIALYSKAFLETTAVQSATIATDAFNEDKTIDKVNMNYSHVGADKRNEINASFDRSKTFVNPADPSNPIVGPGVAISVKDVSGLVTGNTKTKMKTYLKENINS